MELVSLFLMEFLVIVFFYQLLSSDFRLEHSTRSMTTLSPPTDFGGGGVGGIAAALLTGNRFASKPMHQNRCHPSDDEETRTSAILREECTCSVELKKIKSQVVSENKWSRTRNADYEQPSVRIYGIAEFLLNKIEKLSFEFVVSFQWFLRLKTRYCKFNFEFSGIWFRILLFKFTCVRQMENSQEENWR